MQRLSEIRELLAAGGRGARKALGQTFLIDANLMAKLIELAGLTGREVVLEVGPATGSLTEELLPRCRAVVAVELDGGLADILRRRLGGRGHLTVLHQDALAGKHALAPEVLAALADAGGPASAKGDRFQPGSEAPETGPPHDRIPGGATENPVHLVSNLPYNVAVPVILNCLLESWRATTGRGRPAGPGVCFQRLTFTVQRELAERLTAPPGSSGYGPAGVIVALLVRATPGRIVPPQAFWPRPKVTSRMLRLDFDAALAEALADADTLSAVLSAAFTQRRKKILSAARLPELPFRPERFLAALEAAGVDRDLRPQQVSAAEFRAVANALAGDRK